MTQLIQTQMFFHKVIMNIHFKKNLSYWFIIGVKRIDSALINRGLRNMENLSVDDLKPIHVS